MAVANKVQWHDKEEGGWVTVTVSAHQNDGTIRISGDGGWAVTVDPAELHKPSPVRKPRAGVDDTQQRPGQRQGQPTAKNRAAGVWDEADGLLDTAVAMTNWIDDPLGWFWDRLGVTGLLIACVAIVGFFRIVFGVWLTPW